MADIFIAYKRERVEIAEKLATFFRERGWSVWWDPDLQAGEQFRDEIERELSAARCVVVLWCELSVQSAFVRDEADRGQRANALIPVLWADVHQPIGFGEVQAIALFNWRGEPCVEIERLADAVTAKVGAPGENNAPAIGATGLPRQQTAKAREVVDPFGRAVERMRRAVAGAQPGDRQYTGFEGIDHGFDGLPRGALTLLAGRPGMGLTAFVCGMIRNWVAGHEGVPTQPRIGIICKRRAPDDWALRLIAALANVDLFRVRRGKLTVAEFEATNQVAEKLRDANIEFLDASTLPVDRVHEAAEEIQAKGSVDVLVIDLAEDDPRARGAIGPALTSLKRFASRQKLTCIALVTLPRYESSDDENFDARPSMDDIAQFGHADVSAEVVMLLHRDAYYLERSEPSEGTNEHIVWMRQVDETRRFGDLDIAKNRFGPIGRVKLGYDPSQALFMDSPVDNESLVKKRPIR